MTEENKVEEQLEEMPVDASEDTELCSGPCDVWPPAEGACGNGKNWIRIRGRWVCK